MVRTLLQCTQLTTPFIFLKPANGGWMRKKQGSAQLFKAWHASC